MSSDRIDQRLADILENIERIERHVHETKPGQFLASDLLIDGVERCLERIAEAARKLGNRFDKQYVDINLPGLRQLGSVLRHDYDTIRPDLLWDFIQNDMPKLKAMVEAERQAGDGDGR